MICICIKKFVSCTNYISKIILQLPTNIHISAEKSVKLLILCGFQTHPTLSINVHAKVNIPADYTMENLPYFYWIWWNDYFFGNEMQKSHRKALFSRYLFSIFLYTITQNAIQTRKLHAVSVFVLYLLFIDSIFRQANPPFSQKSLISYTFWPFRFILSRKPLTFAWKYTFAW